MGLSTIVKNFLSILVTKRRIFFLNTIFLNFLSLVSKKRGELIASLTSSKNLTNEELKNLNTELSQAIGASVAFNYNVDETLIGGLKMQIGSLMIDTSIKNQLKKYEQVMLEI
jgi:F-type H+-transporting ATPase subunit delta